jgi:pimeloyl-ACP methyl ester carboxylesterase
MKTNNIIQLSDGKKLCYAEYGDPQGEPTLLFHGNPGSRLSWGLYPGSPFLQNIRIIAPDRPGYGRSEFKKHALAKWPHDITELVDHLGIKKFHLFQIKSKIILWHAEEDCLVGNMTKYLANSLPNSELISIQKVGHLWVMEHVKEILGKLINA